MTALLQDLPPVVRSAAARDVASPSRSRAGRPTDPRTRSLSDPRGHGPAARQLSAPAACDGLAPSRPIAAGSTGRLTWTPRGVAVMVCLVLAVVAVMVITLVSAFLSVSDEPVDAIAPAPLPVAMSALAPGQAD